MRVVTLILVQLGQAIHGGQCVGMLLAKSTTLQIESALDLLVRLRVEAKIPICLPDGLADRSFYQRLFVEFPGDARSSPVQCRSDLKVRIGLRVWPGLHARAGLCQQIILQKVVDRLGGSGFSGGCLFRAAGKHRLPGAGDDACNQDDEDRCHAGHKRFLSPNELPQLI